MEQYGDVLQSAGVALEEVESEWTSLKAAIYDEQQVPSIAINISI